MASTFDLTINGTSRISGLQVGTLNIVKTFGRRATLTCEVFSVDGSWHPTINQEVVWTVDSTPIFGGYIRELTYLGKKTADNDSVFYQISCADYSSLLEDRLVTETFPAGQTLKQWLTTLVTNWLSIKGISLDAGQANGPTMTEDMAVDRMRADVVLQQMMLRSEYVTSGGGISPTKTLKLFASGSVAAPFNLTSSNRKAIGDIQVNPLWNGQKYNRVIVKFGVAGVVEYNYQDSITVSGTPTSVTLNYTPVGWYPVQAGLNFGYAYIISSVDGENAVVTAPSPYPVGSYEYDPNTNSISKVGGGTFTNGEVLTVPYDFRYPIEIIEEDAGAATNPIELLVIDESIKTKEEAILKAQRVLAITVTDTERVHYYTNEDDLDVGQTQNVNVPERFFNDDCIITDLRTRDIAVPTNNPTSLAYKLIHEVFATQGEQAKRTELDTVMQWSLLGSGSGAVPGTAPATGGGMGPAPPDYSVQWNNKGVFGGEGYVLYYPQFYGGVVSVNGLIFPETAGDPADTTRFELGQTGTGDIQFAMFGGSYLIDSNQDIFITAGSISTVSVPPLGSIGLTANEGIDLIPGQATSVANNLRRITTLDGIAYEQVRITSLPYTMDQSASQNLVHTAFLVDTTSAGTFNLAGLSATFTTRPSTSKARVIIIKKLQGGTLTIDGDGSDTIDGSAVLSLDAGNAIQLIAGPQATTNWQSFGGRGSGGSGGGSGGGMSAAGNDGDVQYNASGTLSGISLFNYDDSKAQLRLRKAAGGNSTLEIENTLDGTSAGGPVAVDVQNNKFSEIGFGLDFLSGATIAKQTTPGRVQHSGSGETIGFDLFVSQTVSSTLAQSAHTRRLELASDGVAYVYTAPPQTMGASAYGSGVYVGANLENSAAAGWIGLENKSAIPYYIWPDGGGIPHVGLSAPTADNAVSDKSGHMLPPTQFIRKTADQSVVSSTAYQSDTHLVLPVGANETWETEWNIAYDGVTAADIKWAFNAPTSCTGRGFAYGLGTAAANGTFNFISYSFTDLTDSLSAVYGTPGNVGFPAWLHIKLIAFTGSTSGNLTFRWAQGNSNATSNHVYMNSYVIGRRVG